MSELPYNKTTRVKSETEYQMTEENENIENDENNVFTNAKTLLDLLVVQLPERSISFMLDDDLFASVEALVALAEEKIPKNMPKIQAAALEALKPLLEQSPNSYVNMNLNEEDIKAMAKLLEYVERELK
jgi:hypothetical protein